ncbi:MAG: DUF4442 domain-containing protein [Deltaproteobacteria bacterium]|nr:DUF4442 domain-containing protein [Deltaproteobacteria bacterium]
MTSATISHPRARSLRQRLASPPFLRAHLVAKLPLAAFAGLKIQRLDGYACEVTIPYGWRTRNPFGSIYFAALSMAAELSTGALALMAAQGTDEAISALPIGLSASFEKKAQGMTTFTCTDGPAFFDAATQTLETGEAVVIEAKSIGRLADGSVACRFSFTWSFKKKSSKDSQ